VSGSGRITGLRGSCQIAAAVTIVGLLAVGQDVFYPVRALYWHLGAIIWWLVILAGSMGQGALIYKRIPGRRLDLSGGMAVSVMAGLGLGIYSLEVLLLGALGLMNTPVLTLLVLVVLLLSFYTQRAAVTEVLVRAADEISGKTREAAVPLTATLIAVAAVFPLVLVPNRAFDALSYHLEVPLRFLQAGGIVNIPENIYSYSPLLTQMLYGLGLGLEGADLAGLLYFSFFILTLWTVWRGGEKLFGSSGSAWAAALLALMPVFLVEVPQAGADWSMSFFILTALLLLAEGGRHTRYMVLAGILAGMAAGCRHQAIGYALVLVPLAGLAVDVREKRSGSIKPWCIFTGVAVLSASPWYLKNMVQTGDPVYPLLTSLTGGLAFETGFVESLVGSRSLHLLWSWVLVPFQSAFDPLSLSMTASVGVLPLALTLLLPGLREKRARRGFLLLWTILAFLAWHLTFRTFRYVMPVMIVCCLWLGAALAQSLKGPSGKARVLKAAVCMALVVNGGTFLGLTDYVNRSVPPALGIRAPENYIRETYQPYPAIDYLNSLEQPPGRVLFVGEMRGFYSRFPREVPSHNAPNRLLELVKAQKDPILMKEELVDSGFTHILFNPEEWRRMAYENKNAPLWRLSDRNKAALLIFLRERTQLLFSSNGVSVYRIDGE